jgi:ribulose bisphosphate carboxylase small subunit
MSLIIKDEASDKQLEYLLELGYSGNLSLTKAEAAQLIDEWIEQNHLAMSKTHRDFIAFMELIDPDYFERYKRIKNIKNEEKL